jgi:ABC-type transport system involved in cytochrome c biogenesis permease subunit
MTALLVFIVLSYCVGALAIGAALVTQRKPLFRVAPVAMAIGFLAHTGQILTGFVTEGHLPAVGIQEVCSYLAWALLLYYLAVQTRYPTNALAGLLFPTVTALMLVSAFAPALGRVPPGLPGQPFLFSIHAGFVLLAYAAFLTMFMAGVLYIVQEREIKGKHFGAMFRRLPSLDTCDTIGSRSLAVGFVLLTLGIAVGLIWSRLRDGILWRGDPTEVFAVGTWLIYLVLMHYRLTAGWRGRRAALVSIVGFFLVVFTLVVATISGGFHGL